MRFSYIHTFVLLDYIVGAGALEREILLMSIEL